MFRCPVISWGGLLDGGIRPEPSQRRWHGHELGHGIGRDGHRVCLPKPAPLARIKRDAAGIKRRRSGAQLWRAPIGWSTPTGRRCWHSIAFGRSAGGTKSAVPVFYPDSSGMTQVDKPRQGLERFTGRLIAVRPASVLRTWADAARPGGTSFEQMGRRLADSGYAVLVVNPYYRTERAPVLPEGASFRDEATRKKIFPRIREGDLPDASTVGSPRRRVSGVGIPSLLRLHRARPAVLAPGARRWKARSCTVSIDFSIPRPGRDVARGNRPGSDDDDTGDRNGNNRPGNIHADGARRGPGAQDARAMHY